MEKIIDDNQYMDEQYNNFLDSEDKKVKDEAEAKEIRKRAIDILKNEDPIDYIIKIHQKLHIGNEGVAKLLLLSIGSQCVKDSNGLQVSISGSPGKGKTHCCRSMLSLLSKKGVLDALLSDKAVIYENLKNPGTII